MLNAVMLYCPHLNRDPRHVLARVPNVYMLTGMKGKQPGETGEDACIEMHWRAIRHAQKMGWDRVFVMEDDCQFTEHWNYDRWCADTQWAEDHGYDVLTGGVVQVYDPQLVRSPQPNESGLLACSSFHSAHCISYMKSAYEKILDHTPWPYDTSIGQVAGCTCLVTFPWVAVQRPGWSGILKQEVNYLGNYTLYQQILESQLGVAL